MSRIISGSAKGRRLATPKGANTRPTTDRTREALFSALVSHQTPALVKGGYGLVMAACLILWFSAVSCFLTMPRVRNAFSRAGLWINRVTGAVFIAFGIRLALSRAE